MSHLESSHKELLEVWNKKQDEFEENLDIQIFQRDAEQAEAWIGSMGEMVFGTEDIGVSFHDANDFTGYFAKDLH